MKKAPKGSRKARATSGRLFAVQAVYQALQNKHAPKMLIEEYLNHRVGMDLDDGERMLQPDAELFSKIVGGVDERFDELKALVQANLKNPAPLENLLMAILLCGAHEILAHHDIDAPVIIADYLHVTHGFYEGSESKLINGVLDAIATEIRGK